MRSLKNRFRRMNIRQKIQLSTISLLIITSFFLLAAMSFLSQRTLRQKSVQLVSQQLDTAGYNTETTLRDVYGLSYETLGNSWVQAFLRAQKGASSNYTTLERSAAEVLDNQRDSNKLLRFIALIKSSNQQLLYSGVTWSIPNFVEEMQRLEDLSRPLGFGNMSYVLHQDIFTPSQNAFYFFLPVHNLFSPDSQLGTLYICVPEAQIRACYNTGGAAFESMLTTADGTVLSSTGGLQEIGKPGPLDTTAAGEKGNFALPGQNRLVLYQHLPGTGWYILGVIPADMLMADYANLAAIMALVLLACLAVAALVANIVSRTIYRPIAEVIATMNQVAAGNLHVHVPGRHYGEDLQHLAFSFNSMVNEILQLMEQVKEEQRQADKTKFNMLQSQIQPHFLYNVLDSIHWQAAYNKDTEVSEMVQILANYYRLSLSKGNDIIPLRQELDMVHNYIRLQNIRYNNLVQFEAPLGSEFLELPIPKLTLQPLVENAIYHGFRSGNRSQGNIRLSATKEGEVVVLQMQDDGSGCTLQQVEKLNRQLNQYDENAGYGLQNVQKRFEIYYGAEYGLQIRLNEVGGLTVSIRLPENGPASKEGESFTRY